MKKTKKLLVAFITVMMLMVMSSVGMVASAADNIPIGTWSISVVVDGTTHTVTSTDVEKLAVYTVNTSTVNSVGATVNATYTGAKLKDILKSIGVTDVTTVSITTSDAYSVPSYNEALAMNDNTLIAWGKNGAVLTADPKYKANMSPVMLIPGGSDTTSSQFIKYVATLTVTGATLATAPVAPAVDPVVAPVIANSKTSDSSPISAEVILLLVSAMLAVTTTTIGLKKSFKRN